MVDISDIYETKEVPEIIWSSGFEEIGKQVTDALQKWSKDYYIQEIRIVAEKPTTIIVGPKAAIEKLENSGGKL